MRAKLLVLVSALTLAFAGAVSAQTVPAEAWVGPAIATTASQLSRGEVVASMQQAMSQPQAAPEGWIGTMASAGIAAGEAKRSEVMADFNLYQRAGLADYAGRASFDPYSARAKGRILLYERLRAGPEFSQEVARVEGAKLPPMANAKGSDASAD